MRIGSVPWLVLALTAVSGCGLIRLARARPEVVPEPLVHGVVAHEVAVRDIPSPDGLAFDPDGNLYAASEHLQGTLVRITPTGERTVLTRGLRRADGVARDAAGNLYVSAEWPKGNVVRIGTDGRTELIAKAHSPEGLAFDADGRLYIAEDRRGGRILRVEQGRVDTWAEPFGRPEGIAIDPHGNVYVNETSLDQVTRVGPDGTRTVFVSAGQIESPDGAAYSERLQGLFVTEDAARGRLHFIRIADGKVFTLLHGLQYPQAMAFDPQGNLHISEQGRHRILKISAAELSRVLQAAGDGAS
jgi:sugar lactone lactonase YvrE